MWLVGRALGREFLRNNGLALLMCGVIGWLSIGTLTWRLLGPTAAPVVFNVQFGVGAALAAMLATCRRLEPRGEIARVCGMFTLAIGLWLGSLELDRYCVVYADSLINAAMARHALLSVFWTLYAILLIAIGFGHRAAVLRRIGLGLLALTLIKVLAVDLANVQYFYRVLSLLATGLLLIGTSVAYNKLAARFVSERGGAAA